MKTSITKQIRDIAIVILSEHSEGVRFSELRKNIHVSHNFNENTINGAIWDLDQKFPEQVYKADKGLFRLKKFKDKDVIYEEITGIEIKKTNKHRKENVNQKQNIKEEDFYKSFAKWLVSDLEECTKAIQLGGNTFKDKWGTPDVIGKRESRKSDIISFPTEIISAEIKIDSNGLITAFGQACSYKLFSHKSYIVIPKQSSVDDIARLDTLCRLLGIGLILFNCESLENPEYEIRARAIKHEPDLFYVNKNLKLIEDKLFSQ